MASASVPVLVNALCHHLATLNDDHKTNFPSTTLTFREALYNRYRDIAFSELLGLRRPSYRQHGSGWGGVGEEGVTKKSKQRSRTLDRLRGALLAASAGCPSRAESAQTQGTIKDFSASARRSFVVTEMDDGFVFCCSEGVRVFRFLELLATTWPEDDTEAETTRREAQRAHVGRGALLDEAPDPNFMPGLVPFWDSVAGGDGVAANSPKRDGRSIIPAPRGWFDGKDDGGRRNSLATSPSLQKTPTLTPRSELLAEGKPFAYQPSRSPVKVPIGSLFMDKSPGKMTAFDAYRPGDPEDSPRMLRRQRERARQCVLDELEKLDENPSALFGEGSLSLVNHDLSGGFRVYKEAAILWNGEESEIAREGLLALGGVRSSLSKLRGRLLMPEALPRPASVHILSSMVEASEARYLVEDFITPILKERDSGRGKDPISRAFAHVIKQILEDVDRDLVKVEMLGVKSWMQPVGLKMREGVDACGAEYHGMGMSILQLAHATAKARQSLLFLASYFSVSDGNNDDDADNAEGGTEDERSHHVHQPSETNGTVPRGKGLIELLYQVAQFSLEGDKAEIAKRLFFGSLVPYLLLMSRWAFGIEHLTDADPFVAPLSSEFAMGALSGTLGPASIPSFFSAETRKDLIVAGTQLRLLYSWWRSDVGQGSGFDLMSSDVASALIYDRDVDQTHGHDEGRRQGDKKTETPVRWFTSGQHPKGLDIDSMELKTIEKMETAFQSIFDVAGTKLMPALAPDEAASTRGTLFERMLDRQAGQVSVAVQLESSIGDLLRKQARFVSRACIRLFVDRQQLNTLDVVHFLRNTLMGFTGDFSLELVRFLDSSVTALEPITAHKARTAVFVASSSSCLQSSPYTEHLTANLLPKGENAVSLVEDAFSYSTEYSDAIRIKAPYISSMAPVLVAPVGHAAYDCIHVSFVAPGLLGAIISEDTLTAYSAIFSMNVRLHRAALALESIHRATMMGRHEKVECARGDFQLPWAERFKTFRAFCLSCSRHLDSIAQMYRACCSGSAWEAVQQALSGGGKRVKGVDQGGYVDETCSIHTLVHIHKRFLYRAASMITSACNSPAAKLGLETMLDAILDLRNTIDRAANETCHGVGGRSSVQRIFEDPTNWQELKRIMLGYERGRLGALKMKRSFGPSLNETEKIRSDFLSSLNT